MQGKILRQTYVMWHDIFYPSSNTSAVHCWKNWKTAILKILFLESTSEFQTSVTFL